MKPLDFSLEAASEAQREFSRLKRKANKRKADRERARKKRHDARPAPYVERKGPPAAALPAPDARAWSPEAKAHWFTALLIWITEGKSLTSFCRDFPEAPAKQTFMEWIGNSAIMADEYRRAREASADTLAEECVIIADSVADAGQFDSARVNAARLAVDARKWVASKLKPREYADRLETVTSGALTVHHTLTDDERARALMSVLTRNAVASATSLPDAQRLIEARAIDVSPKDEHKP